MPSQCRVDYECCACNYKWQQLLGGLFYQSSAVIFLFLTSTCCFYCSLQLLQDFRYFPLIPRYIQCWPSVVALKRCVGRIYTMYVLFSEVQFNIVTMIIMIPDKRPEISTIVGIAVTIVESNLELKPRSLNGQLQIWSLWLLQWWFIELFPVNLCDCWAFIQCS